MMPSEEELDASERSVQEVIDQLKLTRVKPSRTLGVMMEATVEGQAYVRDDALRVWVAPRTFQRFQVEVGGTTGWSRGYCCGGSTLLLTLIYRAVLHALDRAVPWSELPEADLAKRPVYKDPELLRKLFALGGQDVDLSVIEGFAEVCRHQENNMA